MPGLRLTVTFKRAPKAEAGQRPADELPFFVSGEETD
jgi:hypothetical protein